MVSPNTSHAASPTRVSTQLHAAVPPVMLAECWADYHAVAAKAVFDPEWEKISPW